MTTQTGLLCCTPASHAAQQVWGTCVSPWIQMDLSQEYSSNCIEMVLGWTGAVKAVPCLPGLWLAQSLLLYIKYYFWRLGEGEGYGDAVPSLVGCYCRLLIGFDFFSPRSALFKRKKRGKNIQQNRSAFLPPRNSAG